jgi:hypothetical protein
MTVGKVMRGIVLPGERGIVLPGDVADIRAGHPFAGRRLPVAAEFRSLAPYA